MTTQLPPDGDELSRGAAADDDPSALVGRYLLGELTPAEGERFERWLDGDAERWSVVEALRGRASVRTDPAMLEGPIDVHAWWAEFAPTLRSIGGEREPTPRALQTEAGAAARRRLRMMPTRAHWRVSSTWAGVAAVAVVAATGLWAARVPRSAGAGKGSEAIRTYATARGERAVVTLDGARVVLGPESVLRVPATYGQRDRAVSLAGHGYFDVVHDAARPFRVQAGRAITEDIGTRFDVRAYATDGSIQVIVAEGAVGVRTSVTDRGRAAGDGAAERVPVVLTGGTMAIADSAGDVRVRTGVSADRYVAWSEGRLTFDNTPLLEAAAELGRWYDLDVRLGDARLATKSLTATFGDDPIPVTLVALEGALSVRAVRIGRVVTLYPP